MVFLDRSGLIWCILHKCLPHSQSSQTQRFGWWWLKFFSDSLCDISSKEESVTNFLQFYLLNYSFSEYLSVWSFSFSSHFSIFTDILEKSIPSPFFPLRLYLLTNLGFLPNDWTYCSVFILLPSIYYSNKIIQKMFMIFID